MSDHKIYETPFADVLPHYVAKIERKGRTISELYCVLEWLTGYTEDMLQEVIGKKISFREFFDGTPTLDSKRNSITGVICGVRIENIEEDLMREIRYLDKLVDELAKGKKLSSILRQQVKLLKNKLHK